MAGVPPVRGALATNVSAAAHRPDGRFRERGRSEACTNGQLGLSVGCPPAIQRCGPAKPSTAEPATRLRPKLAARVLRSSGSAGSGGQVRFGPSIRSGDREFEVPHDYPLIAHRSRVDADQRRFVRVSGVRWFTNLTPSSAWRTRPLPLTASFAANSDAYPTFELYRAINVDKVAAIPADFAQAMAVPITFLDKFDPDQFEILDANLLRRYPTVRIKPHGLIKDGEARLGGRITYTRIVIRPRTRQA